MVHLDAKVKLEFSNHREYHIYYLAKHMQQNCRRLHFVGTMTAVASIIAAIAMFRPALAVGGVVAGVLLCWVGDYFVAGIKPTTFKHPVWSARSNCMMVWDMARGDMSI